MLPDLRRPVVILPAIFGDDLADSHVPGGDFEVEKGLGIGSEMAGVVHVEHGETIL